MYLLWVRVSVFELTLLFLQTFTGIVSLPALIADLENPFCDRPLQPCKTPLSTVIWRFNSLKQPLPGSMEVIIHCQEKKAAFCPRTIHPAVSCTPSLVQLGLLEPIPAVTGFHLRQVGLQSGSRGKTDNC